MNAADPKPSAQIIEQAAEWAAILDADDVTQQDLIACAAWCDEHPSHREALERLISFNEKLSDVGDFEHDALRRIASKRTRIGGRVVGIAGSLLILAGVGWSLSRHSDSVTDYATAVGEQRDVALADGSHMVIDTHGAVKVRMEGEDRSVELIKGQIMATVAHATGRPFVVRTPEGSVTALGTAFVVRREASETWVTVIQSHVRVCPAENDERAKTCRVLGPGMRARMTSRAVQSESPIKPDQAGLWAKGWLEADDRAVSDLLIELNRYRKTPIRFDEGELNGLRVTGGYPLRDTDRALDGIARASSLTVERSTNGEVTVYRRR